MSLSGWFRDYLFIPLGGSRGTYSQTYRNLMVVFIVSGLWHGAGWSFAIWGLLHGVGMVVCLHWKKEKYSQKWDIPTWFIIGGGWLLTQSFWIFSLIFFRGESRSQIIAFLDGLVSRSWSIDQMSLHWIPLAGGVLLYSIEWIQRHRDHALDLKEHSRPIRWGIYITCGLTFLTFCSLESRAFVYFQF